MVNERDWDAKDATILRSGVTSNVRVAMNAPVMRNSNDPTRNSGYRAGQPNSLPAAHKLGDDGCNSSHHPAKHDCGQGWVAERILRQLALNAHSLASMP
jgi:hypothetical protein